MKISPNILALLGATMLVPAVALAAGPFNEGQARQKIESSGYTKLSGLHEGNMGEWMANGMHDGRIVAVILDAKGVVSPAAEQQTAQAAAPATAGIQVQQMPAQVTVKQAQPDVTVTQGQPTITVHQPAPTVTVEIPQPEITVHMPKPNVAVSMAQPEVNVNQPKPQVNVAGAVPAKVSVQHTAADVSMDQSQAAPVIKYDADQAKVVVKQAPGSAPVRIVDAGDEDKSDDSAAQASAATSVPTTGVQVSRMLSLNVTNMHGDVLGDIEHVVKDTDGKDYVIIGHGGFLGLGQKHVALPLDKMVMRNGRMEIRGVSDDQIKAMKSVDDNEPGYTDLQGNQTVKVGTAA